MPDQLDIFTAPRALDTIHGNDLTSEERLIIRLLQEHKGRESAVSVKQIGELFNMTGVAVRSTVRHLIDFHCLCIGSSVSSPSGYFLAVTAEEVEAVTRSLRHRGISILARAAKLQGVALDDVYGQGKLELEAQTK